MYTITIDNEQPIDVEDFAVVNLDGDKTLYVRLMDGKELGYKINDKSVKVMLKEEGSHAIKRRRKISAKEV